MLKPMNQHLDKYALIEGEQRGAKVGCSGTIDNLLIDRMVCEDSKRNKRNLSMAWIDVKKAYNSVDHKWLVELMAVHRFPDWVGKMVSRLCATWNTRIVVTTKQGRETSDLIKFNKGLPKGDAFCPRLFTICLNPVAWQLKASEGYKLSKPISAKITDLFYIDDLKVFAASATKMTRVLKATKESTKCMGMQWNEKKCAVTHMKKGALDQTTSDMKLDESAVIARLKDGEQYKFLEVQENLKQEDNLVLNCDAEIYLKRVSVIWSSPLSDHNRITATNQFALPVPAYLMRTQKWPIADLQQLDRETRKIMVENGGKHPLGSKALLYLPRKVGGRGLKSVENECKLTKIKTAVNLYQNQDLTVKVVRVFEERATKTGYHSLIKDAVKYAKELDLDLKLSELNPTYRTEDGNEVSGKQIGVWAKKAQQQQLRQEITKEKWQGKLLKIRWEDDNLSRSCFDWLKEWKTGPSNTIAAVQELYQQLLPTKLYHHKKTGINTSPDVLCRMCGKCPESVPHIVSGCSTLAQTKYLARHNSALKILFFEMLRDQNLVSKVPSWYSPVQPKPMYENERAKAFWDVPVYAESVMVKANRIDARIVEKERKRVAMIEMSCPWMDNRAIKDAEKTAKYGPLRWELKQQYPGYEVKQFNIIIDVLGGWSVDVEETMKDLVGQRSRSVLRRMQKVILSHSLNIARTFKVLM